MKIVNNEEMSLIDLEAQNKFLIPELVLMENAGIKLWLTIKNKEKIQHDDRLVFLPGKGNNGGDALVIARQAFIDGYSVSIVLLSNSLQTSKTNSEETKKPASLWLSVAEKLGIAVYLWDSPEGQSAVDKADFLFDGLYGVGIKGRLRSPIDEYVKTINEKNKYAISIDVPSGIGDGFEEGFPCIKANATYTVEYPKNCMYTLYARAYCGDIYCVPIGFPKNLSKETVKSSIKLIDKNIRKQAENSEILYKNKRGSCYVFAGGEGTLGAAQLSSTGAAKAGAGLVTLYLNRELYPQLSGSMGGVMVKPCEISSLKTLLSSLPDSGSSVIIGPGLTWLTVDEQKQILSYIASNEIPSVIDAEALKAVDINQRQSNSICVLTPHPGEFLRWNLCSRTELNKDPVFWCQKAAEMSGCIIVLKSFCTYIACPDKTAYIYDGMNHTLGTGGSGDVLAGIIGGLLSTGISPVDAAVTGVRIHGEAGMRLRKEKGYFLAEELMDHVGKIALEYKEHL